jgi:hypothetical protein
MIGGGDPVAECAWEFKKGQPLVLAGFLFLSAPTNSDSPNVNSFKFANNELFYKNI